MLESLRELCALRPSHDCCFSLFSAEPSHSLTYKSHTSGPLISYLELHATWYKYGYQNIQNTYVCCCVNYRQWVGNQKSNQWETIISLHNVYLTCIECCKLILILLHLIIFLTYTLYSVISLFCYKYYVYQAWQLKLNWEFILCCCQ